MARAAFTKGELEADKERLFYIVLYENTSGCDLCDPDLRGTAVRSDGRTVTLCVLTELIEVKLSVCSICFFCHYG